MEQSMSMPPPDAVVRPWRTATLIASTVAAFELVLILILGVALLGKPLSERMRDTAQQRTLGITTQAKTKPKLASSKPTLSRAETTRSVTSATRAGRTSRAPSSCTGLGTAVRR